MGEREQRFIDIVHVQVKSFKEASELLNVDLSTIRQLEKDLRSEWRPIANVKKKWNSKKIGGNFWDFYDWTKTTPKHCHYCHITQEELDELHENGDLTKRLKRGRSLEIDRIKPNENYSNILNLVYACAWCNNAKTDTFNEDEFKIIGNQISVIWKNRLGK